MNKSDITLESVIRAGWIFFTIGLFSFTIGIGYLLVGLIVMGVIELGIAGFLAYKAKKELDEREKQKLNGSNGVYNRDTVQSHVYDRDTVQVEDDNNISSV